MSLKEIIERERGNIALVIGNGINRYGDSTDPNSWEALLLRLANKHSAPAIEEVPKGLTLTEFYDILDLANPPVGPKKVLLQKEFCSGMADWEPFSHHRHIIGWARRHQVPVLTTNFDGVLAKTGPYEMLPRHVEAFTDYYPWENYYSDSEVARPDLGFGIWHINGMRHYRRSIRLGLSHYMGSVARARAWIHAGGERRLFGSSDIHRWAGASTWIHVVMVRPLVFFGLGLGESEVFLRWLLVERARYFRKFPQHLQKAWFVYTDPEESPGKLLFLKGIGIEPVKVSSYEEIYGAQVWD